MACFKPEMKTIALTACGGKKKKKTNLQPNTVLLCPGRSDLANNFWIPAEYNYHFIFSC